MMTSVFGISMRRKRGAAGSGRGRYDAKILSVRSAGNFNGAASPPLSRRRKPVVRASRICRHWSTTLPMNRRTFLANTGASLIAVALPAATSAAESASDFDVVVYGGVPCGIAAAIAAAREGASVLLIEPTKHVGGLNTSGLNTAETEHMLKWTFGGIALEFYERLGRHYGMKGPAFYFESSVAEKHFTEMLADAKVPVRFGLRVEKVEKDGARIRRIILSDGS